MILIIIMILSLKELPPNLNIVGSSRIFQLGLLTILVNIFFKYENFIILPNTCPKIMEMKLFPQILPD